MFHGVGLLICSKCLEGVLIFLGGKSNVPYPESSFFLIIFPHFVLHSPIVEIINFVAFTTIPYLLPLVDEFVNTWFQIYVWDFSFWWVYL